MFQLLCIMNMALCRPRLLRTATGTIEKLRDLHMMINKKSKFHQPCNIRNCYVYFCISKLGALLLLVIDSMYNFAEFSEACTPLKGDVSMKKLVSCLDILFSINLELIVLEVSDHLGISSSFLACVVIRSATTCHSPGLVWSLSRPGEDVWALHTVESIGKTTYYSLLDQIACSL